MAELPQLASSNYAANAFNLADVAIGVAAVDRRLGLETTSNNISFDENAAAAALRRHLTAASPKPAMPVIQELPPMSTRVVEIYIVDPDENVPLADRLIYRGDRRLTDLTDQELFYEIDIKGALTRHNETRVSLVNKAVKERTEHLEPLRIRDLKMVVITIAEFK